MNLTAELPYFSADRVSAFLPLGRAMDALGDALKSERGIDPEQDGPRLFSPAPGGEFLIMPSQGARFSGIKALTVAPENPARGLQKIQGIYVLYTSDTLSPAAVMDGASLTAIRTPAVTVAALRWLAEISPPGDELPANPRILVFGAGVQAEAHIRAASLAFPDASFEVVGRSSERLQALITCLAEAQETRGRIVRAVEADGIDAAVRTADIIICVTTASAPLFDGALVRDGAIVAAAGTHGRDLREIDDALVARSDIVVEARDSARRENGNLVSLDEPSWSGAYRPTNLRELARGEMARTAGRPAFYTGVGMSWEDLVCAAAVFEAAEHADASN